MLRILDYPWHQVHLYRLAEALPARFTLLTLRFPPWNGAQRPLLPNVSFMSVDNLQPHGYDLAILHLDQWCDDRLNLRAMPYRIMKQSTQNIPQVVIMHGTPDSRLNRQAILRLIGDLPVVCNSRQAAREWDGGEQRADKYDQPQFTSIIHGYRDEFFNYPLSLRSLGAITICSGGKLSREYHGLTLVERLKRDVDLTWVGPRGDVPWKPNYTAFRGMLAASLLYFSPTRRAPMPGARTEAMLSGCCVVSVPGNDIENYIESWVNGVIVENYIKAREAISALLDQPECAYTIGQRGRKNALKFFDHKRYTSDWLKLLGGIGVC